MEAPNSRVDIQQPGMSRAELPTSESQSEVANDVSSNKTDLRAVFITYHMEVANMQRINQLWPLFEQLVALADEYDVKLTIQFAPQWATYVYSRDLLETVYSWEQNGHEIALHHHGPTHKYFDGYTNQPDIIRTDGWYIQDIPFAGDMADFMDLFAPLSPHQIVTAGMSDESIDWPGGSVLYFATDSGDSPSKDDLLSTPVEVIHNGYTVIEIYNSGYAIDHLGGEAVSLVDVEQALHSATSDQIMGLVLNDNTIEAHFDEVEPLFRLLKVYELNVQTVKSILD